MKLGGMNIRASAAASRHAGGPALLALFIAAAASYVTSQGDGGQRSSHVLRRALNGIFYYMRYPAPPIFLSPALFPVVEAILFLALGVGLRAVSLQRPAPLIINLPAIGRTFNGTLPTRGGEF